MAGSFLAHKGDGEPRVKTIWLGLQPLMDFVTGLLFRRDPDVDETCV